MEFEAGWSPEGAVCVRRVRISGTYSLDRLRAECPRLRPEDIGAGCTEERMQQNFGFVAGHVFSSETHALRSKDRARAKRDITVPTGMPTTSAISR